MQVEAQKPSWQTGSTAPLNLAGNIKAKGDSAQKENLKLQLNLDDDGGEEMIIKGLHQVAVIYQEFH